MTVTILRPSMRVLSVGQPGVRITQPGGAAILDVYDPFTAGDGALAGLTPTGNGGRGSFVWQGATWTIASGAVLNTPALGDEKLVNGTFEADANWSSIGTPPTNVRSNEQAHGGTYSRKIVSDAAYEGATQQRAISPVSWLRGSAWLYVIAGAAFVSVGGSLGSSGAVSAAAWTQLHAAALITNIYGTPFMARSVAAGATFYVDDASLKPLTSASLFAVMDTLQADDVTISATVAPLSGNPCGVVLNLDSLVNPQNAMIFSYGSCIKLVGGVWSIVSTGGSLPLESGKRVALSKSGDVYRCIYNGEWVGGNIPVAGMTGTLHGLMSMSPGSVIEDLRIQAGAVRTLTTLGDSISTYDWSWNRLLCNDVDVGAFALNQRGAAGQTIMGYMDTQVVASAADGANIIIVILGTNDMNDAGLQAEYQENLTELMSDHPGASVFAMQILPRAPTQWRTEKNVKIAAAAAAVGVECWNTDDWIDPVTDTSDGLHPTAAGQAKITAEVKARLVALGLI